MRLFFAHTLEIVNYILLSLMNFLLFLLLAPVVCWFVLIFISFVAFESFYYIFFILYIGVYISTSHVWGCGVWEGAGIPWLKCGGQRMIWRNQFCPPWVRPWVISLTEGRALPLALVCFGSRVFLHVLAVLKLAM